MIRIRPTRLLALGGLVLVGFLYWKPAGTYLHTKQQLEVRQADVRSLRAEKEQLERRIARRARPTSSYVKRVGSGS